MKSYINDAYIEKAIKVLCKHAPDRLDRPKRLLMHDIRVGMFLYDRGYSKDIVVAGFLHDMLEWTQYTELQLEKNFGSYVCEIVKAQTKDRSIKDPVKRRKDYVRRCTEVGVDALIVKAADAIDSYQFYACQGDKAERRRAQHIARMLLKVIPKNQEKLRQELSELQVEK